MTANEFAQTCCKKCLWITLCAPLILAAGVLSAVAQAAPQTYLGFDSNNYPGDANVKILRQTFSYTSYWLNNPPGEHANPWKGHRATVQAAGFGFLVLFNGRLYADLKSETRAAQLGKSDAAAASAAARHEGFPANTIIFLDQEQGGRMLPEQSAYIYAFVDGVVAAGFRAGVYCSGTVSPDEGHVVTANDIREHAGDFAPSEKAAGRNARPTQAREITFWVANDACPPAPGCAFPQRPPGPAQSGVSFADIWQFAQSPRRKDVAGRCTNYGRDGNCYAPGVPGVSIDVNTATSSDPSGGRTR